MKKVTFLFICVMSFLKVSMAQQTAKSSQIPIEEKLKKYEGTYQVQVINSRQHPSIPYNLDEIILKNRDKKKIVYVQLGSQVRLEILPEEEITKATFKKIPSIANITE